MDRTIGRIYTQGVGRCVLVLLGLAGGLLAQRSSTSYFDLNGNRVEGPALTRVLTPSGERRVVTIQSINGRETPVESAEDRVISKSETSEVIERTVVRYDADGNPGPPERVRIERSKHPDGGETVRSTVWRADLNGNFALAERSVFEKQSGGSETVVERAEGGALQVVERVRRVERGARAETVAFRRDANGEFFEASREVTTTAKRNGEEVTDTTRYERGGAAAELEPSARSVTRFVERPDGSKVSVTDVYSRLGADVSDQPRWQRQIRQEERPGPGGATVIVTSVRHAPDAGYQKIQETVVEPVKP